MYQYVMATCYVFSRHTCNLDSINEFVPPITLISKLLLYANSCTNPVIYNFMSGKFRKEFRTACSCCFRCCCNRQRQSQGQVHEMEPLSAKRYYYVSTWRPQERQLFHQL
uniref:G-protein coupled receptors family 1 profile domain-containing protein n=1 Tax=Biomphalaria glabrata TaxID=6526 RepID=A0A2C9KSD6_BIOGL